MAIDEELLGFVRESLARGQARSRIEQVLREAGWGDDRVRSAMAAFADVDFPVPVPRPRAYLSAKEAFLYLVMFSTLYLSAYHLGSLVFSLIDHALPDPARTPMAVEMTQRSMRWSVSSLLIAFPVFLYVSRLMQRAVRREPAKRSSRVRKWLTYMTLFIAACVVVGDLTVLVFNVLGGELGLRFLLKTATVAVIAGAIFAYYLIDLRAEDAEPGS